MSIAAQRPMTIEDFLACEEHQEPQSEFDGFTPSVLYNPLVF